MLQTRRQLLTLQQELWPPQRSGEAVLLLQHIPQLGATAPEAPTQPLPKLGLRLCRVRLLLQASRLPAGPPSQRRALWTLMQPSPELHQMHVLAPQQAWLRARLEAVAY